jgi:hypothetical protein
MHDAFGTSEVQSLAQVMKPLLVIRDEVRRSIALV